jgi:hypothetical protein
MTASWVLSVMDATVHGDGSGRVSAAVWSPLRNFLRKAIQEIHRQS